MAYISTCLWQEIQIDSIITIHYFEYMKNFSFTGESHNFWEICCVDKGEVEVQADGTTFILKKDDVVFHKPMEFHSIKACGPSSPNLVVLSFECSSQAMSHLENQSFHLTEEEKSLLSHVISEAKLAFSNPLNIPWVEQVTRSESPPFGAEQLIKLYLEQLLISLVRGAATRPVEEKRPYLAGNPRAANLEKVIDYLELHIGEHLTISKICRDNLIGRSALQDQFHCQFSCGIIEYFIQMKIDLARQMIRDKSKNFSEISDFLGFNSLPYFSRQFKRHVGMSPTDYASSIMGISEKISSSTE